MNMSGPSKKLFDGVYIKGMVGNEPVIFTADTGASKTILSYKVYQKLKDGERPSLEQSSGLRGAGGSKIKEWGKGVFRLTLGHVRLESEMVVADIEDDALIGCDVLAGSETGPADILLSQNVIVLKGEKISCVPKIKSKSKRTRKVVVADDVTIPGKTEALVDVFIERVEDDDLDREAHYLVEASNCFKERYKLAMASTLVDINHSATNKVRVMNPYTSDTFLRQDAIIGTAEN